MNPITSGLGASALILTIFVIQLYLRAEQEWLKLGRMARGEESGSAVKQRGRALWSMRDLVLVTFLTGVIWMAALATLFVR